VQVLVSSVLLIRRKLPHLEKENIKDLVGLLGIHKRDVTFVIEKAKGELEAFIRSEKSRFLQHHNDMTTFGWVHSRQRAVFDITVGPSV
jgi:hypothetical protein